MILRAPRFCSLFWVSVFCLGLGACASAAPVGRSARVSRARPLRVPLHVPSRPSASAGEYRLGERDVLTVRVLDLERPGEVSELEAEIEADGTVLLPFAGAVLAAGRTVGAVRGELVKRLAARYLVDPQVTVRVKEYLSRKIAVLGAVEKPGEIFLRRNRVTLVEALSLAGGLSELAGTRAWVQSGRPAGRVGGAASVWAGRKREVDLIPLLLKGDVSSDFWLEPGSVVRVPVAEPFFVGGYVRKAGAFSYQRPTTVLQAIALGGGLDERFASPSAVRIKRPKRGGGTQVIEVDLEAITAGEALDVPVYPRDSIEAGRTLAWAVYSEVRDTVKGLFGIGFSAGRY